MILLRLLLILTAIALVILIGVYALTSDNRYLRYARQILRFVVFALLVAGAFFLLERVGLAV